MPCRGIFFKKHQPVHIISRAIEGFKIFEKEEDCFRFIFYFYAANFGRRNTNLKGKDMIKTGRALLEGEEIPKNFIIKEHPPLVYLLDFSFVINHYHFYLLSAEENSPPILIQRLNNAFAKYFNLKHHRKGVLFSSRYKSVLVETGFQADAVSRYVSIINPLDVYQSNWRREGLRDWKRALNFLENYPFSSFPDKIGKRNSKILAPKEILEKYSFIKNSREKKYPFKNFVLDFLKQKFLPSQNLFLE